MPFHPADVPLGTVVVVTSPNRDCSPDAFHAFLDELLAGPEPELYGLNAAQVLQELPVDVGA